MSILPFRARAFGTALLAWPHGPDVDDTDAFAEETGPDAQSDELASINGLGQTNKGDNK